jgi:hypothetical protein
MRLSESPFIGTWRLVSVEAILSSGEITHPMGRDAAGYLTYTEHGYMAVTISHADRPKFASADPDAGSPEERAAAFDTYFSYSGTYAIDGTKAIHRIEFSLFPNWVGTDQERYFEFHGDRLVLRTPQMTIGSVEQIVRVTWQRVGAEPKSASVRSVPAS